MNKSIRKIGYFFTLIFIVQALYLVYINVVLGPKLASDPHNRRLALAEEAVVRGTIYDLNGVVLAADRVNDGRKTRVYPYGLETAHLLGFISDRYGRTGLESSLDLELLALDVGGRLQSIVNRLLGRKSYGYDVYLTVDRTVQHLAWSLLRGRNGSVVAVEPDSGAIIAMVSSPSFDPEKLGEAVGKGIKKTGYELLMEDTENSPLLNKAARGAYPPGSVFKLVTLTGVLAIRPELLQQAYDCTGSLEVEGFVLKEKKAHGVLGFREALAVSCNIVFGRLGLAIGEDGIRKAAGSFGFVPVEYQDDRRKGDYPVIAGEIPFNPGTMPKGIMDGPEVASTAIGQGRVLVSPMQMALVAAGIANEGKVMQPVAVERVVNINGKVLRRISSSVLNRAMTAQQAAVLTSVMEEAVTSGTASRASVPGVRVAGKTGTAQNPGGKDHAWFVGFAPADNPRIALAVVLENEGSGGSNAAPVASQIFKTYLGL